MESREKIEPRLKLITDGGIDSKFVILTNEKRCSTAKKHHRMRSCVRRV